MPFRQRTTGGFHHLKRTGNADAVARFQACCRFGIAPPELLMQGFGPIFFKPLANRLTNGVRHWRHVREPPRQRLEVKSGSSDENRQPSVRLRFREHSRRVANPCARRIIHRGIDMTVKPVRNARLLLNGRTRGDDAQIAIDLHRIRIDDGTAYRFGQIKRQRRLAAGGRPCDKHRLHIIPARIHVPRRYIDLQPGAAHAR